MAQSDIDIDGPTDFNPSKINLPWTRASLVKPDMNLGPHPCGYYPQTIPKDPVTGLSAIPYSAAESIGFVKIDFLHVHLYDAFKDRQEIDDLCEKDPNWDLLLMDEVHPKLFQLSRHGELLKKCKPRSISKLADVLALIRPGKKHLLEKYLKYGEAISDLLYEQTDEFTFKKAHGISYAILIALQLHLIEQGRL